MHFFLEHPASCIVHSASRSCIMSCILHPASYRVVAFAALIWRWSSRLGGHWDILGAGLSGCLRCCGAYYSKCIHLQPTVVQLISSRWRTQSQTLHRLLHCLLKVCPAALRRCTKPCIADRTVKTKHYIYASAGSRRCIVFATNSNRNLADGRKDRRFL